MKVRIESIGTLDGDFLESIDVRDVFNFNETVRVLIGAVGGLGEEIFDVQVSSPRWIESQCEERGYWLSQRTLVISHWDTALVRKAIQRIVLAVSGDSWTDVAHKLAAFMWWEFQDYKEL